MARYNYDDDRRYGRSSQDQYYGRSRSYDRDTDRGFGDMRGGMYDEDRMTRSSYRGDYDRDYSRSGYNRDYAGRGGDYDRDYGDRNYRQRDNRYDRGDLEGYELDDGRVRWDYFGRGPAENDQDHRGRYTRDYDRDRSMTGGYGRDYDDRNRSYGGRDYDRDYGDRNYGGGGFSRGDFRSRDYGQGAVSGPMSGRGPQGYTQSAERITEQVSERLTDDGWVDASGIIVSVENGEVTLKGTVSSREEKRRAEDIAESVRGVDDVHNRLTIELGEMGQTASGTSGSGRSRKGASSASQQDNTDS